ncbi:MAG: cyclic nucleotide-binding domain-containing protein [Terasakiella sp.]|uniref:cyclic nucleotide-binding domain-containing protein n=1 Tax=unclassified Terasakiella TaxID=2614952 RepID=UPI003B004002
MSDGGTIKKFKDGEIIFNEGEASGAAYVIIKGAVELTKNSKHGAVRLANLKVGELFGEMGIIDASPRSATARAVGPSTLKEIQPENLLKGIQTDPDLSSKVMSKLVERLRAADEMLAKAGISSKVTSPSHDPTKPAGGPQKKKGFFSRLFSADKGRQATFEILLADFHDDPDNQITEAFFESLKTLAQRLSGTHINIRRTESPFALNDFNDNPMVWGQMKSTAQRWLNELDGDLLVWGQARNNAQTVHLRLAQLHPLRHERAGSILPCDGIDMPSELDDTLAPYLYGVVLAGLIPSNKTQLECMESLLESALSDARPALQKRMRELKTPQQARFETGLANLMASCGYFTKKTIYLKEAEETYLKVLRSIRRGSGDLWEGIVHRHLAYTQNSWFEMGGEKNLLEAAIESLREASRVFEKSAFPTEWADLQAMIGQLLYKKDQIGDDDNALQESISAYQNALQVFTASATPQRWGEAKHHLARALQLLGSQRGDLDMIARSAEACREALAVRSKTHTPMLWAATQNNLGSALFMLCQKTRKPETADAAVKAFQAALDVYEARKATKLAQVTQKNLTRAQEVAIDLGPLLETQDPTNTENFTLEDFDDSTETAAEEETLREE